MALSVIIVLYVCVGILAAAGSIFIAQQLFSAKAEQIFFALFLVAIAAFYLAFTAYFGDQRAWRLESGAVIEFGVFGLLGGGRNSKKKYAAKDAALMQVMSRHRVESALYDN